MLPSTDGGVQGTIVLPRHRGKARESCACGQKKEVCLHNGRTLRADNSAMALDCQSYLEEMLPNLLRLGAAPAREVVVQFVVGDNGNVFYRIGPEGVDVVRGVSDRVDLTLAFQRQLDVVGFARAELDLASALRTERLEIHGDEELLPWLAERLSW